MDGSLKELGVGGLIALLVIKQVLGFLKERRLERMEPEHTDIERWDELERAIYKLSVAMEIQTKILDKIADRTERIEAKIG